MHRHEFSPPSNRRHSMPVRSALARSAFSSPIPQISTTYEKPTSIIHPAGRALSEYLPRNVEHSVRFREPDTDTMSDGGLSITDSEGSERTGTDSVRRKRSLRTSTTFQLAHPAPTLTQKQRLISIRPKLLLQLQRIASDTRPRPILDVLPSTLVVPRLKAKFPRMFKGKAELGVYDVMVVKSEEYDTPHDDCIEPMDSDEECVSNRDLIAVICQMRKDLGGARGTAEIVLHDSVWTATPKGNNIYEFISVDKQGEKTTARWVGRPNRRKSTDLWTPGPNSNTDFKFTFSILNPNTRRHPIMGTLTQNTLNIPDQYISVSSSAGKHPPTSPMPGLEHDHSVYEEPIPERTTHTIDEDMKTLIQVTGIWVALRQGVSPYFKYNDSMTSSTPLASPRITASRVNSSSLTPDGSRFTSADPLSTTPDSCRSTFGSVKGKIQRTRSKASPVNTVSSAEQPDVPRRALSVGTAFMQRAETRRSKLLPSTVVSDSEGELFEIPRWARADMSHSPRGLDPNRFGPQIPVATTPETPTRSQQRRVQSAYIPSSGLHTEINVARHSLDGTEQSPAGSVRRKIKTGRWKSFTNFFKHFRHSDSET